MSFGAVEQAIADIRVGKLVIVAMTSGARRG
jgi:hypothetical protein